ncbi:hypothetical protein [Kitasatospora sp. NPDC004272]
MPTQTPPPAQDIKAIIKGARRREKTVPLCLAGDLVGEYEELERQLSDVAALVGDSLAGSPRVSIAERMEELRAQMAEHLVLFRFRALDPRSWSDLLADHPGTAPEDVFDLETFGPAAIAACAIDPAMSVAEFGELAEQLSTGQQRELMEAVWEINTTAVQKVPFSLLASATAAGRGGAN